MPIFIKDFTWSQTDDYVIIRVPVKYIDPKKADIFVSENFVKVHYPPHLFEVCLFGLICEENSRCTLGKGEAIFELKKIKKEEWPTLNTDVPKKDMVLIKLEATERAHKLAEINKKKKEDEKNKRHSDSCKRQMELDKLALDRIDKIKKEQYNSCISNVIKWKLNETDDDKTLLSSKETAAYSLKEKNKPQNKAENTAEKEESDTVKQDETYKEPIPRWLLDAARPVEKPPPRQIGKIQLNFTPRAFPTPVRESNLRVEEEWLKKQAEARRASGFVEEDLRPEEKDPEWLLTKGKSLHAVGSYLGAINAYSYAIKTWDKIPELYAARSETHVCLENWRKVLLDTTTCLELCRPHLPANADLRYTSFSNRGRALIEIGRPDAAIPELEEALELRPFCEKLHHLLDKAERVKIEMQDHNNKSAAKNNEHGVNEN